MRKILFSLYTSLGDDLVLVVYLSGLSGLSGLYGLYRFSRLSDILNNLVKAYK